jgi:hypothetical protein
MSRNAPPLPPSKSQLVRGPVRQSGNLVFSSCGGVLSSVAPVTGLTDEGQRLGTILASRCIVDCGPHALAGSAMR